MLLGTSKRVGDDFAEIKRGGDDPADLKFGGFWNSFLGIVGFENLKARKPVRERPEGSLHASLEILTCFYRLTITAMHIATVIDMDCVVKMLFVHVHSSLAVQKLSIRASLASIGQQLSLTTSKAS
jgi:succinate-acetate transporter protein